MDSSSLYKLIIVDDEKVIREGLADMIDWTGLGFTVAGKLGDGKDAIEYLKKHVVDVVLTDIKMTFASGLEVARYVREQLPHIKVVLLSGYKEFEMAKEAIRYNVSHYLLKPTDMDEVSSTFGSIRAQLEREKEEMTRVRLEQRQLQDMVPVMQEQFFCNLLLGVLSRPADIREQIRLLGLNLQAETAPCRLYTVEIPVSHSECPESPESPESPECPEHKGYSRYQPLPKEPGSPGHEAQPKHPIKTGQDGRLKVLRSLLAGDKEYVRYIAVSQSDCSMQLLAVSRNDECNFEQTVEQDLLTWTNTLKAGLGLELRFTLQGEYPHINALAAERNRRLTAREHGIAAGGPLDANANLSETLQREDKEAIPTVNAAAYGTGEAERSVIKKAKVYIVDRFADDLTLEQVADYVYLNPVYFSRLFKRETGANFSDYVIRIRMEKAMEYLKEPRYKVYEIGPLVGYRNIKYFYKIFKKSVGVTPMEYRERL